MADDRLEEFDPEDKRFQDNVRYVRDAVVHKLRVMRKSRQRIYLSRPTPGVDNDLAKRARRTLHDEFHGQGYRVLPDQVLFDLIPDDQIRAWQEQCTAYRRPSSVSEHSGRHEVTSVTPVLITGKPVLKTIKAFGG